MTHALTARVEDFADLVKKEGGSITTRSHTRVLLSLLLLPLLSVGVEAVVLLPVEASLVKAATSAFTNVALSSRPFAKAFLVAVRTARAALSTYEYRERERDIEREASRIRNETNNRIGNGYVLMTVVPWVSLNYNFGVLAANIWQQKQQRQDL